MRQIALVVSLTLALAAPAAAQAPSPADNAEMAAILAADQAARQDLAAIFAGGREGAARMAADDADRRRQVQRLLEAGELRTAADFDAAAWVYQHGDTAEDYLMAHTLAVAALGKGSTESTWIAAATLDRYLQKIGQPQIYGTQNLVRRGQRPTREPYDHALVPPAVLTALGVSTRPAEEARQQTADTSASTPPQ